MSKHNEEMTDGNIADMGRNLSQEVKQYINDYLKTTQFKLTFIGHSLGGVIIRAALPHLIEYKVNMYTFVSLSSPHLGYGYNNSLLIDAGKNTNHLIVRIVVLEENEEINFASAAGHD